MVYKLLIQKYDISFYMSWLPCTQNHKQCDSPICEYLDIYTLWLVRFLSVFINNEIFYLQKFMEIASLGAYEMTDTEYKRINKWTY